jgi:hypothetical protein
LLITAYRSALQAVLFIATRRGKLTADTLFCCEWKLDHCNFFAQTKQAMVEMTGENSQQKSFPGQMSAYFALHVSFAHIGPRRDMTTVRTNLGHFSVWLNPGEG